MVFNIVSNIHKYWYIMHACFTATILASNLDLEIALTYKILTLLVGDKWKLCLEGREGG